MSLPCRWSCSGRSSPSGAATRRRSSSACSGDQGHQGALSEEEPEIRNELIEDGQTKAMKAQQRVADLQAELAEKEALLASMKAEDIKDEERRKVAVRKWREMEAEIASLSEQLSTAEEERDGAPSSRRPSSSSTARSPRPRSSSGRRRSTGARPSTTRGVTRNLWSGFVSNAKVEICDRGGKKRHENCLRRSRRPSCRPSSPLRRVRGHLPGQAQLRQLGRRRRCRPSPRPCRRTTSSPRRGG